MGDIVFIVVVDKYAVSNNRNSIFREYVVERYIVALKNQSTYNVRYIREVGERGGLTLKLQKNAPRD